MHDTKPKTAPCRACGAQVENGFTALVGLLPSQRDGRLCRKWAETAQPESWQPWQRRQFERWLADFEPLLSFCCGFCLDAVKSASQAGEARTPFPVNAEPDDELRDVFIDWSKPPRQCAAESWSYRVRHACHAMALHLHESHPAEGGATNAK